MNLTELLAAANGIYDSLKAGEPLAAWGHAIKIQQFLIESGRGLGFKSTPPGEGDTALEGEESQKKEVIAKLKEAKKLTAKPVKGAKGQGAVVGALGDGKLLAKLLQILLQVLPLIFNEE